MRNVFAKMALSAALVLALGLPSMGFAAEAAPDTMMHMKDMSKGEMMMQQGKGMMDKDAPMTPGRKKMMEGHDKMMQGKKMMMEGHTMMMDGKKMMDMEASGAPKK